LTGQNIANDANVTPPAANSGNVTRLAQPGSSLDRLIAKNGGASRLDQLMMAVGPGNGGYVNTDPHNQMMANLSWDSQTAHFHNETLRSAKDVFSRLTSNGLPSSGVADPGAGAPSQPGPNRKKSVLDAVLADLNGLNARLGASDRLVMNQYADSIRKIEGNLQPAGAVGLRGAGLRRAHGGTASRIPAGLLHHRDQDSAEHDRSHGSGFSVWNHERQHADVVIRLVKDSDRTVQCRIRHTQHHERGQLPQ
jgi:Protein of unknown function (DUF1552)